MQSEHKITIAIDGYSSCGKSTLAKALAKKLHYTFIDSGAMYRGVTLYCMQNELITDGKPNIEGIEKALPNILINFRLNPITKQSDLYLNDENVEDEIRMPNVASNVSIIAAIKAVRQKLVSEQRKMRPNGGIIMDGRDIGTVVFPDAELKLFITASSQVRAQRRYLELLNKGHKVQFDEILQNILERDQLDSTREESPLIQAEDAFVIDTTDLTPDEQLKIALIKVRETSQKALNKTKM